MKRIGLAIKKADLFLSGGNTDSVLHEIQVTRESDVEAGIAHFLHKWQVYRKSEDAFFRNCHSVYRSTKANGEVEWTKAGLNPRSLHKKADVEKLQRDKEKAMVIFEQYSAKKSEWRDQISKWNEDHSREKAIHEEKLIKLGFKDTKFRNELEHWRETHADYVVDSTGRKPKTLKTEKNFASRKAGEAKQQLQALEEEIFRQQSVDYFGLLLRKNGNYFLAMAEKDDKDILQSVPGKGSGSEALIYRSLTFKALAKQAGKQSDFDKKLAEKCRFSEGKRDKDQPTQEELSNYVKQLAETLERMNATEDNGFSWDAAKLKDIVDRGDLEAFRIFVNENCYRKEWAAADWRAISDMDKRGEVLLFQIYSQDFAIDPDFALNERDKNRRKKTRKESEKQNLHTRYWLDCFERTLVHSHCGPESRIYLRPKKSENDLNG